MMANVWITYALALVAKVTLVLMAAFFVTRWMRSRPAAERHLVWMLAAVGVLVLPLFSLALPSWPVAMPSWFSAVGPHTLDHTPVPGRAVVADHAHEHEVARGHSHATPAPSVAPGGERDSGRSDHEAQPAVRSWGGSIVLAPAALSVSSSLSRPALPRGGIVSERSLFGLVVGIWLVGCLIAGVRVLAGFAGVRNVDRRARPLGDGALRRRALDLAEEIGVRRPVRLLEGDADAMPITFGVLRPALLLPSTAREWTRSRQESVLRHELTHIRRRDSVSQLIAELGCVIYWFHPLMWWAARSLCVEREHACDDAVLAAGSRASDYAAELVAMAAALRVRRNDALAAIAMARRTHLRTRITALLEERMRQERTPTKLLVPAWLATLVLTVFLSSLMPASAHSSPAPTPSVSGAAAASPAAVAVSGMSSRPEPAVTAPTAASPLHAVVPASARQDCLSGRQRSVNSNTNDDRHTIKWSGTGCSGEIVVEGDVEFNAAFTAITGISRGGRIRITTEEGGTERRVLIEPADGGVAFQYWLDGDRREMDAAARDWLSSTLVFMFRRFGFMGEARATAILQAGGPGALLDEVTHLEGDYVRAVYMTVLIDRGRLDDAMLRRALGIAGSTISSDHYRTQIITAVAGRYEFTDAVRDAYIEAVSGMKSDHYRHVAFTELLDNGRLTPAQVSDVLRESRHIGSDHYRAQLLEHLATDYGSNPAIRPAYLEAAQELRSDHYRTGVLNRLLAMDAMSGADLARVVDAVATMSSDHYRADVLQRVAEHGLEDATLQRSFVNAAAGIRSDHYLENVLSHVVSRGDLDESTLLAVLEAASGMKSDHYLSSLLVDIAARQRLSGDARDRFQGVMDGIRSETYRGRVALALMRNQG
jgi:beta-lactamase regulating signal transducer with metallopeptidase domain